MAGKAEERDTGVESTMTYSIESPSFDVLKLVEVEDGYWNITNKQKIDYDSMDQAVIQFILVATELLRKNAKILV